MTAAPGGPATDASKADLVHRRLKEIELGELAPEGPVDLN